MASLSSHAPRRTELSDPLDDALARAREAITRLRATLASLRQAANSNGRDPSELPTQPGLPWSSSRTR
jgi:hypothetical protein